MSQNARGLETSIWWALFIGIEPDLMPGTSTCGLMLI
jgi:hypothetical protein